MVFYKEVLNDFSKQKLNIPMGCSTVAWETLRGDNDFSRTIGTLGIVLKRGNNLGAIAEGHITHKKVYEISVSSKITVIFCDFCMIFWSDVPLGKCPLTLTKDLIR